MYEIRLQFDIFIIPNIQLSQKLKRMIERSSVLKQTKLPRLRTKPKSVPEKKIASNPLDFISAKSWLYYSPTSQYGYKTTTKREIASITKIMTYICAIELCAKYEMSLSTTYFKVTEWSADINGTSANLIANSWVSILDLLYGLMLPSGNDAALVLAQNIGAVIYFDKAGNHSLIQEIRSIDLTEDRGSIKFYLHEFIAYMNQKCQKLKMNKTRFMNPHGLDMLNHYSTCEDVLALSKEAMKGQLFRKIVRAPTYKGKFRFLRDGKGILKPIIWNNTNKLLGKSFICGIKTGNTSKAGSCLTTAFKNNGEEGIIIVLGSSSADQRFKDTLTILNWVLEETE